MPIVKICGLSTPDTLDAALDAGADMVGFVFFARSPRHVEIDDAAMLGRRVGARALKVALTVDAGDDALDVIVAALRPDALQLHGSETPDRIVALRQRYGLPAIKAVGIAGPADLPGVSRHAGVADWLLLDAKPPAGAGLPGGNGRPFDWTVLSGLDRQAPFMLSGGLDASNVAEAIRIVAPDGVDVSSGVEERPGVKSPDRIQSFVAAARAAFTELHRKTGALQQEASR